MSDTPMMDVVLKNLQYFDENTQTQLQILYAQGCSLERKLAAQKEQFRVLEDEMLVMMDERNAAVKDAERYRWLRERHWEDANMFVVSGGHSRVKLATNCPSGEFLDAAIDAAMKEMK